MSDTQRILVIGGTVFLGRHVVDCALAAGHHVTVLSRGLHGQPPAEAEHIIGDRRHDLGLLRGRRFDRIIDTCGFEPSDVANSASSLNEQADRYVFVSSVSAYRDWPAQPVDEESPLADGTADYGALKAACEAEVDQAMPGRVTHVRPGEIVGPYGHTFRLPWWVKRIGSGGDVLAPGHPDRGLQLIDARDLAAWMLTAPPGTFNATAPVGQVTMGALLDNIRQTTASDARLRWVDDETLLAAGVEPWEELPLWVPVAEGPATWDVDASKAEAHGLRCRPIRETVADVWRWLQSGGEEALPDYRVEMRVRGLSPEVERRVLAKLPRESVDEQ